MQSASPRGSVKTKTSAASHKRRRPFRPFRPVCGVCANISHSLGMLAQLVVAPTYRKFAHMNSVWAKPNSGCSEQRRWKPSTTCSFRFCSHSSTRKRGPSEIKYLVDALEAQQRLWMFRIECGHAQRAHPYYLFGRGGGVQTLEDVAKKCKCQKCGRRDAVVIPSRGSFELR